MYFDSHAHLDDGRFQEDFDDILARMKENGVTAMMNIGCDLPSSENSVRLAQTYDWIWAAVGSHPDDADHVDAARIEVYRALCKSPRVQAIGEIGLDYHYEDVPREVQKHAFRLQMQLARECSLPVVVHEREAHEDGLKIVDEFPDVTGVFHCFGGTAEEASELLETFPGFALGIGGVVTFKKSTLAAALRAAVPLSRIVAETDAPYLAPTPHRGKRNEPAYLPLVVQKLSEIYELAPDVVAEQLLQTTKKLFPLAFSRQ